MDGMKFRRDKRPRARYPDHLTHLPPGPLPVPETRELSEAEADEFFERVDEEQRAFEATLPMELEP